MEMNRHFNYNNTNSNTHCNSHYHNNSICGTQMNMNYIPIKSINYGYVPTVLNQPKTIFAVIRFPEYLRNIRINDIVYLKSNSLSLQPKELENVPLKVEDVIGLRITLSKVDYDSLRLITDRYRLRSTGITNNMLLKKPDERNWGYSTNDLYLVSVN